MRTISSSELIINDDGSVFHLHLRPGQVADTIVLVGDPARVAQVAARFDRGSREVEVSSREFHTVTGTYKGRRMTVVSHGIGTDNIDIVVTELDALVNVDFETRQVRPEPRQLTMLRLGTSGALQPDLRIGDLVFSRTSVGFDGLLNFYEGRDAVCDLDMEEAFMRHTGWNELLAKPYFVDADAGLFAAFADVTKEGITISAPGFYGPQGRHVRLRLAVPELNDRIESFRYPERSSGGGGGRRITNFEMESSALAGLSRLMGHRAATVCTIIAQRVALEAAPDYGAFVENMIEISLDRLAEFE
ncbi:MAG: nucleoside phosphorylase [Alistipes sp.]|jgi:uridine phosphorylase|nr:nucleoside phosphorylase [Alistipes sp.]